MKKTAYFSVLAFTGICVAVGLVACSGSSDVTTRGQVSTGGTSTAAATSGQVATGGTQWATGGAKATGGSATSQPTGGVGGTGGTSALGSSAVAGSSATGGSTSMSVEQTCADVCSLLATRARPLVNCVPADCVGTCNSRYAKLYDALPACGYDYLAMLQCGATQPADSWLCNEIYDWGVTFIYPSPLGASTDTCSSQVGKLLQTMMSYAQTCGRAAQ